MILDRVRGQNGAGSLIAPWGAFVWEYKENKQLSSALGFGFTQVDHCMWRSYRRPLWIPSDEQELLGNNMVCRGGHKHMRLRGNVRVGRE